MNNKDLIDYLDKFKGKKIGVIGDLILDKYVFGNTERISPEAPVPVVVVLKEFSTPGGAGNVAFNIASLGGKVTVVGAIGKDQEGLILIEELKKKEIDISGILKIKNKYTSQKTRIITQGQHIVRVDKESIECLDKKDEKLVIGLIKKNIQDWDIIVISDYAKGFTTPTLIKEIIKISKKLGKLVIADTKPKHALYFKNVSIITPNYKEAREISNADNLLNAGKKIQSKLKCKVLITQGNDGMTLFDGRIVKNFPAYERQVFDVSGAGDTVVASFALSLAVENNFEKAAIIANCAAGIAVSKVGTSTVSIEEIKSFLIEKNK